MIYNAMKNPCISFRDSSQSLNYVDIQIITKVIEEIAPAS